jgi:uncharacterized protein
VFAVIGAMLLSAGTPYINVVEQFRAGYEAELRAPDGWLSVTGLIWLNEGVTKAPGGAARLQAGRVRFEAPTGPAIPMKSDKPGPPNVVNAGGVAITLLDRGGRLALRVRDPSSAARRNFTGCQWFPIRATWDIKAKWVPYPKPKQIPILNILGMTDPEPSPGYAEFTIAGNTLRLEPITEADHLFFIFKDRTAGKSTYAAGRFLYAALPRDGRVELDFNKAENPPCAFTAYATCPLPPRQNVLPVAIEAGEKKYGNH